MNTKTIKDMIRGTEPSLEEINEILEFMVRRGYKKIPKEYIRRYLILLKSPFDL